MAIIRRGTPVIKPETIPVNAMKDRPGYNLP